MVDTDIAKTTRSLNTRELDIEILRLIKTAQEMKRENFKGSVQDAIFKQMRDYLSNHSK